jgi:dTDP-4-dehydrorhamnose 3,5-epimerase-like enzyme
MMIKKDNDVRTSIQLISVPHYVDERGDLTVVEEVVPFDISRVFAVRAMKGAVRGKHAHKKCSQFMVCVSGSIQVVCYDGVNESTYLLDRPSVGINVPPGVWAQETYEENGSILMVFCDYPYVADDYINDINDFREYKRNME